MEALIHDEILIDCNAILDLEEAQLYIKDITINEVNFDVKFETKKHHLPKKILNGLINTLR